MRFDENEVARQLFGKFSSVFLAATLFVVALVLWPPSFARGARKGGQGRRNAILFVADGLRAGSVNERDTPALWFVRSHGVHFANSHSLFPTFTTPNASAIATGHGLGDTGDFANRLWVGYRVFDTGNFGRQPGTSTPGIENDRILADLSDHYGGNYLNETTLLTMVARLGYNTASIGKVGPAAILQIEAITPVQHEFPTAPSTVIVDDSTGTPAGIPLPGAIADEMARAGLSPKLPVDDGEPNARLRWLTDVATRAVLAEFQKDSGNPFVLFFWCPEPDATQHGQSDSLGKFDPGINGSSSTLAIQNADKSLRQILDWLDANPAVKARTDLFVTADHGFATISRQEIDRAGTKTASESAKHNYLAANGSVETAQGTLPDGFLAIDLALGLKTNLFDPDRRSPDGAASPYRQVRLGPDVFERPAGGDGFLGGDVKKMDGSDAKAIVAANGGSDLIYVPDKDSETVRRIVRLLTTFDYVGAIFVDDRYGAIPGALPLSAIGLVGSSPLPRPAVVVGFKVFYFKAHDLQTAIQISDTGLQEGQGMHGGLGRDSTFNNMAAIGTDFKVGFEDSAPVSNADIAPTIAHILGFDLPSNGKLTGRIALEALRGKGDRVPFTASHIASPAADGRRTILYFQELNGKRYYDRACFIQSGTAGGNDGCS